MNVKLPSDNLTNKEKSDMNGNVETYQFNSRVSWERFKKWPKEIQREFLEHYREKFNASVQGMSEYFEIKQLTMISAISKFHNGFLRGSLNHRMSDMELDVFRGWLKEHPIDGTAAPVVVSPQPKIVPVEKPQPKPEQPYFANVLCGGEMTLVGRGSEIASTLFGIFRDQKISVYLRFERFEEEQEQEPEIVEESEVIEEEPEVDDGRVNINTAGFIDLRKVGFSDNIAVTIIGKRPYSAVEDLLNVPGVNGKMYNIIAPRIKV